MLDALEKSQYYRKLSILKSQDWRMQLSVLTTYLSQVRHFLFFLVSSLIGTGSRASLPSIWTEGLASRYSMLATESIKRQAGLY